MKRLMLLAILVLLPRLVLGADVSPHPLQITMSVDADLINFVKITIWLGGAFLAIYALIGVAFFGFDVRKARGSIIDAQKEVKELLKELRDDYVAIKELKEKLEELGAKLQEDIESSQEQKEELGEMPQEGAETSSPSAATPVRMRFLDAASQLLRPGISSSTSFIASTRSSIDLIREVIASSNYEWTTIGRIMKKTGLSRDVILREAQSTSDIIISYGSQTKDNIFKFDITKSQAMITYELKCKRMITNLDGNRVEDKVVATNGEELSIKEAVNLALTKKVRFLYQGTEVTNLDMLPECPP